MPLVEIKDFNVLIDNKSFFDQPIKNKQESYEKLIKMKKKKKKKDTAGNLLDFCTKNCESFTKCITKVDVTAIDNFKNLDLVMPMYNLIQYSSNYSETSGRFMVLF